jgi:hypothetical protein
MGQPASVYYKDGKITHQFWTKENIQHRGMGLPAVIDYNYNEQTIRQFWYKNGQFIKGSY